ncbi:MAG: PRC-barrel domain-containing protein [Calditrichia bacterium]
MKKSAIILITGLFLAVLNPVAAQQTDVKAEKDSSKYHKWDQKKSSKTDKSDYDWKAGQNRLSDAESVSNVKTMLGLGISDRTGKDIGKIEDLMIDTRSGRIQYAILSFDGYQDTNGKYYAVPYRNLDIAGRENRVILDVNRNDITEAPGFNRTNWPQNGTDEWQRGVDEYWQNHGNRPHKYLENDKYRQDRKKNEIE